MKFSVFLGALLLVLLPACHPTDVNSAQRPAWVQPQSTTDSFSALSWIQVSELPREGQQVYALIGSGGPFKYAKDGVTFSNREGILPPEPRNYYREYTVPTPGVSNRGTRRIICGGQPKTSRAECYYTADHYASFKRIRS